MYQDLTTGNDWPVKEAIVDLPNKMRGSGGQKRDIGQAALQTLLTRIRLRLRCKLSNHDLV